MQGAKHNSTDEVSETYVLAAARLKGDRQLTGHQGLHNLRGPIAITACVGQAKVYSRTQQRLLGTAARRHHAGQLILLPAAKGVQLLQRTCAIPGEKGPASIQASSLTLF